MDLARIFLPKVVVCDVRLPDIDGFEIARAIKADSTLASCYVIGVTGLRLAATTRSSAVNEYFLKPVEPKALLAAVDRAP